MKRYKSFNHFTDSIGAIRRRTWDIVDLDADIEGRVIIKGMGWIESIWIFIKGLFS